MAEDWDWTRVIFDHVQIAARDLDASVAFYRTVLEPLDIPVVDEWENAVQFANLVVTTKETPGGPGHIAFVAASPAQVDAFHRAGIEAGYEDHGAPGIRERYSSEAGGQYYAAFLLDPDGNNIEAVHRIF
jgi:catechol 2,3-dioxygenase-like lactoylglutathione lyase family enzyme